MFDGAGLGYPICMSAKVEKELPAAPHPHGMTPYPGRTRYMPTPPDDEMRDYAGRHLADPEHCRDVVEQTAESFGGLDILVNNVAYQAVAEQLTDISDERWRHTFAVNIDSFFHTTKAALPHLTDGGAIVNTASINGLRGNKTLIDYSATKGAVIAFTYALSQSLQPRGIRVNCVAPGPVWTPLIPATMDAERVASFGENAPFGRPAQPDEIAPSYVFFAAGRLSSYYSGEVLAPLGGETLPG